MFAVVELASWSLWNGHVDSSVLASIERLMSGINMCVQIGGSSLLLWWFLQSLHYYAELISIFLSESNFASILSRWCGHFSAAQDGVAPWMMSYCISICNVSRAIFRSAYETVNTYKDENLFKRITALWNNLASSKFIRKFRLAGCSGNYMNLYADDIDWPLPFSFFLNIETDISATRNVF